jgi:hypothetical protein
LAQQACGAEIFAVAEQQERASVGRLQQHGIAAAVLISTASNVIPATISLSRNMHNHFRVGPLAGKCGVLILTALVVK